MSNILTAAATGGLAGWLRREYGMNLRDLFDGPSTARTTTLRKAIYCAYRSQGHTLCAIGQATGRKHSTISHGLATAPVSPQFRALVTEIAALIPPADPVLARGPGRPALGRRALLTRLDALADELAALRQLLEA